MEDSNEQAARSCRPVLTYLLPGLLASFSLLPSSSSLLSYPALAWLPAVHIAQPPKKPQVDDMRGTGLPTRTPVTATFLPKEGHILTRPYNLLGPVYCARSAAAQQAPGGWHQGAACGCQLGLPARTLYLWPIHYVSPHSAPTTYNLQLGPWFTVCAARPLKKPQVDDIKGELQRTMLPIRPLVTATCFLCIHNSALGAGAAA